MGATLGLDVTYIWCNLATPSTHTQAPFPPGERKYPTKQANDL